MAAKKRLTHPRIFTDVLQAIFDLRDVKGSTVRKIVEQVQTAVNNLKQQPKPRNIVMQVQRALRHGVTSGVLKQKAGKYKLSFGCDAFVDSNDVESKFESAKSKGKKCKPPKGRKCIPPNRRQKRNNRRKRQTVSHDPSSDGGESKEEDVADSRSRSTSYKVTSDSSRTSAEHHESQLKISGRPKRNAWGLSKTKKIHRPSTRCKRPRGVNSLGTNLHRPKRLQRKDSPEPTDPNTDNPFDDIDVDEHSRDVNNESKIPNDNQQYQQQGLVSYIDDSRGQDVGPPECDNPECLCNLKQEPDEDSAFES